MRHLAQVQILKEQQNPAKPGVVAHTCNSSTPQVKARGGRVQGQPELPIKSLSQKKNQTKQPSKKNSTIKTTK
jgi:hypothetical protein